jgi:hypothetical protein
VASRKLLTGGIPLLALLGLTGGLCTAAATSAGNSAAGQYASAAGGGSLPGARMSVFLPLLLVALPPASRLPRCLRWVKGMATSSLGRA